MKSVTLISCLFLLSIGTARATLDWDTSDAAGLQGGAGIWSTGDTNWTNDDGFTRIAWDNTANAATIARFGVSGGTATVTGTINLGGIQSVGNINGYSLTGDTLAFGSFQGSIDTTSLTTGGSNVFTINSALTGTGGLTIAASGNLSAGGGGSGTRLDLLGDNTGLTGGIAITAGLLRAGSQDSLGANTLTLTNQAGLVATASISLANDTVLSMGGGTLRAYGTQTLTLSGNLSGSGTLRKTDGGTVVLTGDNSSHSGGIEILGGILRVGNGGTTGNLGSGDILNNSGLRTNRTDTFTLPNNISGTGTIITEGPGTTNFNGVLTSTGQIGVSNNGTMVINNAATTVGNSTGSTTSIDGSLQVMAGNVNTVVLNCNSGTSSLSGGSITAASNVRIGNSTAAAVFNQNNGSFSAANTTYLADNPGTSVGTHNLSGGSFTQSAGIYLIATRGTGVLNVSGTGTLTTGALWFGHNSVSGSGTSATINLDGGVIQAGRIERPGGIGTSIFNFNGGALRASQDNAFFIAGNNGSTAFAGLTRANVRDGGAVIDSNGFNITIGQALLKSNIMGDAGTGGLIKKGAGTLSLTASNTYEGDTIVEEGTLALGLDDLHDESAVRLSADTTLALDHGAIDVVAELWVNGVQQPAGIYNSDNSGFISGTGALDVTNGPPGTSAYNAWLIAAGLVPGEPGNGVLESADGSGVANLIQFALGGDPNDPAANGIHALFTKNAADQPALVLTVAVRNGAVFAGTPTPAASLDGIAYAVEGSATLGGWSQVVEEIALVNPGGLLSAPTGYVLKSFRLVEDPALATTGFLRIKVTEQDD